MSDTLGTVLGASSGRNLWNLYGITEHRSGSNPGAPKHLAPAGTPPSAMTKQQRTARGKLTRRYALGLEEPKISRVSNLLEPEKRKVGAAGFVA